MAGISFENESVFYFILILKNGILNEYHIIFLKENLFINALLRIINMKNLLPI